MTGPTFPDRYGSERDLAAVEAEIACPDCPAEITRTDWRFRVVHTTTCPTWQRYARNLPGYTAVPSGEIVRGGQEPPPGTTALLSNSGGAIPCGTSVTHRGPYKRRTQHAAAVPGAPENPDPVRRSA